MDLHIIVSEVWRERNHNYKHVKNSKKIKHIRIYICEKQVHICKDSAIIIKLHLHVAYTYYQ